MKTMVAILVVSGVVVLANAGWAQQQILVHEEFETLEDGSLPLDWQWHRSGANPECSEIVYQDLDAITGLSEGWGLSMVLASNDPSGCDQTTGVQTAEVDISGCDTLGFFGRYMSLNDTPDPCDLLWAADSPPDGDCFGFSTDGETFVLLRDIATAWQYHPFEYAEPVEGPFDFERISIYFTQHGEYSSPDEGVAFDSLVLVCNPREDQCADLEDNDFDLLVDCDDTDCTDDADEDGFNECSEDADCDDHDATVYPGASEVCDGLDNDCDGSVPDDEADGDQDGFSACAGDCDDGDDASHPDASELCDDQVDNDCDGLVDGDDPSCTASDDDDSSEPADDDDASPSGDDDSEAAEEGGGDCSCSQALPRDRVAKSISGLLTVAAYLVLHRR